MERDGRADRCGAASRGCRARTDRGVDRAHRAAEWSPATQSKKAIERFAPLYESAGWTILPEVVEGARRGYRMLASHYPYKGDSQESDRHTTHRPRWDDGVPLLHGHTHARDHGPNGHQFHVGIDAHAYAPIPFAIIDAWIRGLPDVEPWLDVATREARQTIANLDSSETSNSNAMFYTMGYNELRVALEELLGALDSSHPDSSPNIA